MILTVKSKMTIKGVKAEIIKWLMIVLLTLPHMNPPYLSQVPFWDSVNNGLRITSFLIIFVEIIYLKQKILFVTVLIILSELWVLLITVCMDGAVKNCFISLASVISVVLLYELKDKEKNFLSAQLFCFELVIYINLITELLYPEGMYQNYNGLFVGRANWFLGYYNNHSVYYIPALLIAFLYKLKTGKNLRTYILTGAIFIAALWVKSGGVLMGIFGMAAVYVCLKNKSGIFNYYAYWGLHIVFYIFVIRLKLYTLFQWLLDGVLNKWRSMEQRSILWDVYIKFINRSLITGYGVEDGIKREIKGGFNFAVHAHNLLLEIVYQGGIFYLFLWVVIIVMSGKKVYRYRESNESKIISIAFFGWCICTLVEPFMTPFLMSMFIVACHSND